ncbi:unnamed protein product [Diatraea saccharalis]|uniref:Cyclic GMP-AMP synthase-like n=1 Tax=Diatraea saccharalis TaxID=40085 RepID=A0A9N9QX45_9NEOP|nr:unnamed protein product [Diatraea saccharalis]
MMTAKKKNLDANLEEIFKEYIAIKDEDYKKSQDIFKIVFDMVKVKMGEKCNYFKKYSSQVMIAGSVDDGIKVSKLDEFDMDIVIRLPINHANDGEKGIIMEYDQPGFVKLKIIDSFDHLDKQPEWEKCHVVTKEWRDAKKYFLQNKFRSWLHGIVQKALNDMNRKVTVNGVSYLLSYKESGPAYTLNIKNDKDQEQFYLDVDLVPVIRFSLPRWPSGYRCTGDSNQVKDWYVVPKPNKSLQDDTQKSRCWRLSFQAFEKDMMKNRQQLKKTIRYNLQVKKLRDSQDMKAIASYYIKTLFLWKISKNDDKYWQAKLSLLFHTMVKELYDAVEKKCIPFFWHKDHNLIEGLKPSLQKIYLGKLDAVLKSIEATDVDSVVDALLTPSELKKFKSSEFYQNQKVKDVTDNAKPSSTVLCKQTSISNDDKTKLINSLISKVDRLTTTVFDLQDRVKRLEMCRDMTQTNRIDDSGDNSIICSLSSSENSELSLIEF